MSPAQLSIAGVVVAAGFALGLASCGGGRGHDDASPRPDGRAEQRVCAILEVPLEHTTGDLGLSKLLEQPSSDVDLQGTAAAILLLRSGHRGDLGPYEPVIDHLAEVGRVDAGGRRTAPKVTVEVRRSARRLDRDLAQGMCT